MLRSDHRVFRRFGYSLVLMSLLGVIVFAADKKERAADQESLSKLQAFVGEWRGVGQAKRGANDGSWIEQSNWVWKFTGDSAALTFTADKAKYIASGEVRPLPAAGKFRLTTKTAIDNSEVIYTGSIADDGQLVFVTEKPVAEQPERISLRTVAGGDRLVVLYERRGSQSDRFNRLAEVGYTRKGSQFGKGATGPECIVTGGFGSMTVTHKGETYYVCCTGCRDIFTQDPDSVIADYRARKTAEKNKTK